jgi:hypothetical protein
MTLVQRLVRAGIAFTALGTIGSQVPMTGAAVVADGICPGPSNPAFKMTATNSSSAAAVGPTSTIPRSSSSGTFQSFFTFFSTDGGASYTAVNANEWKLTVTGPTSPDAQGLLGRIRWSAPGRGATTVTAPNSETIADKQQVDLRIPGLNSIGSSAGSVDTQGTLQASYTPAGSSTAYIVTTNLVKAP